MGGSGSGGAKENRRKRGAGGAKDELTTGSLRGTAQGPASRDGPSQTGKWGSAQPAHPYRSRWSIATTHRSATYTCEAVETSAAASKLLNCQLPPQLLVQPADSACTEQLPPTHSLDGRANSGTLCVGSAGSVCDEGADVATVSTRSRAPADASDGAAAAPHTRWGTSSSESMRPLAQRDPMTTTMYLWRGKRGVWRGGAPAPTQEEQNRRKQQAQFRGVVASGTGRCLALQVAKQPSSDGMARENATTRERGGNEWIRDRCSKVASPL